MENKINILKIFKYLFYMFLIRIAFAYIHSIRGGRMSSINES